MISSTGAKLVDGDLGSNGEFSEAPLEAGLELERFVDAVIILWCSVLSSSSF